MVCNDLIFDLSLWTVYTDASLILEKPFSRASFYGMACFSISASGPHLDPTTTSQNIFRRSSIEGIIFNRGSVIWMLVLF